MVRAVASEICMIPRGLPAQLSALTSPQLSRYAIASSTSCGKPLAAAAARKHGLQLGIAGTRLAPATALVRA